MCNVKQRKQQRPHGRAGEDPGRLDGNAVPDSRQVVAGRGGVSYTQPQILAKLSGALATYTVVTNLRTQLTQAIAARDAAIAGALEFLKDYKVTLVAQLGRLNPQLSQFGFGPVKAATPLTAAQKVIKAAKAQATRVLVGTKGPKQKATLVKAAASPTVAVGSDGTISIVPPNPAPKGS